MMGANGAVLFSLLIYAALLYGAVRLIKYFIRYGIVATGWKAGAPVRG